MSDDLAEISKTKPDNGWSAQQIKEARALMNNFHGGIKTKVNNVQPGLSKQNLTLVKPDKKEEAA